MSVKRAVLAGAVSRRHVVFVSAWLLCACNFQTQPLFEASRSDPATGAPDADVVVEPDAAVPNTNVIDAGAEPTKPVTSDAGITSAPACKPAQVTSCSAGRALTCRADGSGFEPVDCGPAGCNAAANGCNACLPRQSGCSGDAREVCGPDGRMQKAEACALGCVSNPAGQAACRVCEPGASMCSANALARCAPDGMSWQMQPCMAGCDAATHSCTGSHLVPANLPRDLCRTANVEDRDVQTPVTIDTDEQCMRVIPQAPGQPEICLFTYGQLRVREGVTMRVQGSRALALVATHSLRVEGRISVSAHGTEAGPGSAIGALGKGQPGVGRLADGSAPGPNGGDVLDWTMLPANAGGGGGGHATPGAPGGDAPGMCGPKQACATAGAGGMMHGSEQLTPLQGGSDGGSNSASGESSRRNDPGGGGGALQLVACEELILGAHAVLDANGGGGEGGGSGTAENTANDTPGAGAGGGSGGAILIQARMVTATAGSVLVANGGGGGGGASRMGGMREMLADGGDGQDGQLSSQPAAGGMAAGQSQPGGAGGALMPPMPGGSAKTRTQAAGGGGGAAGRIRIEIGSGDAILQGVVISPPASRGGALFE